METALGQVDRLKEEKRKRAAEMDLTADKLKCNKTIVVRCVTVKAADG